MTNLAIQKNNHIQSNNETDPIYLFQSYTVRSWSPLKLNKSVETLQLRASEIKPYFGANHKTIFDYVILAPDQDQSEKLGYCWNIYSIACKTLTKRKHVKKEDQDTFFTLLEVIHEYSKTSKFSSPLDHFLLGLVHYHLAYCNANGIGTQKNKTKALKNFISASKCGISQATEFLTFAEQLGLVSPPTKKKHHVRAICTDTK
ncbi:MAG: SEL1-like repeat protein [Alphaproteobacteria bacterium]|jgi:hypothetical protein|nr:SEL1-like repeat protein [Alphaproteobacteria bacterium]